jgi:two-component system sensor histidine kinase UhpB
MWQAPRLEKLTVRVPLLMLGTIFLVEAAIMAVLALSRREDGNRFLEIIVDSVILTLAVAPLLYWLVVLPLRRLAEERSQLLAHIIEIQDLERQRVARDLHDEIGQLFTSLLVQLRVLADASSLETAKAQASDLRKVGAQIYDQIRSLSRNLYPIVLDDFGLAEAVRRMAEDFEAAHGVTVAVRCTAATHDRWDRKIESTAFRVVQESLTNCAKYAHATHVDISLTVDGGCLAVDVTDNGRGFDAAQAMNAPNAKTFGLRNMRERALLLHGSLTVRSQAGQGTTVRLRLPTERI